MSIRWDCEADGCYKDKCIPDWGFLMGAFPRGIRPTDVDGIVEISGRFLLLEWKNGGSLPDAQRWLFERITNLSNDVVVVVIFGDSESSTIEQIQIVSEGKTHDKTPCSTDEFVEKCRKWGGKR